MGVDLPSFFDQDQAIVQQEIVPHQRGRVSFQGSSWYAECDHNIAIAPGEVVDVVALREITLVVEPASWLKASNYGLTRLRQALTQQGIELDRPFAIACSVSQATQLPAQVNLGDAWNRFIQGKPVHLDLFKAYCAALELDWKEIVSYPGVMPKDKPPTATPAVAAAALTPSLKPNEPDLDFVGREDAIAELNQLIQQGAKIICIQGKGGLGKTTLARRYIAQHSFDRVLECWMANDEANLTSVESLVQEWLRDLGEQPGHELWVSLDRLRKHLRRDRNIAILIDNLESALDRGGKLLPQHQGFVELLRVLADPELHAVTLLTTREPLHEASLTIHNYRLKGLAREAWQQFFVGRQLTVDPAVLEKMHQAYGGNAKAMTILCSAAKVDYGGDIAAYWRDTQADLLGESDLENLIISHFNRLLLLYPDAYRLLCRLGCYRYQDVPHLPIEGLHCLLWDVPSIAHRRVIKFLSDLFMVESQDGQYWLHPVIQAEAIALLQNTPDWQTANRAAAAFWTEQVTTIETTENALMALEAYYHYLQIQDFEAAAQVILLLRDNPQHTKEPLGVSFYRLGLLRRMMAAILAVINRISEGYPLSKLYNILGDLRWLIGDVQGAIACHQESRRVAIACQLDDLEIVSLFNLGLCQIELDETETAVRLFETVEQRATHTQNHKYAVGAWFCLAYLYSQLGNTQRALKYSQQVLRDYQSLIADSWSRGYSLLFLGRTYRNLGDLERAQEMYQQAQAFAEESHYNQVKANALNGLAQVFRARGQLEEAIANHLAAQRLLDQIEAKCDLANVYFQLGLTHQQMNAPDESKANFRAAMELFHQIGAAKQIEKVRIAMRSVAGDSE